MVYCREVKTLQQNLGRLHVLEERKREKLRITFRDQLLHWQLIEPPPCGSSSPRHWGNCIHGSCIFLLTGPKGKSGAAVHSYNTL